ncbi:MAG: iron-containing redox enzyme family protein [Candidatus Accumulibacter sp. UW20]|jgi:pyrroloquinoline quinone (PQQ) biosynthesis protein C
MFPKLKENVWHIDPQQQSALLITSCNRFQVPTAAALEFLRMRSYCTGWHSLDNIADRSGLALADVKALLASLAPAGIVYGSANDAVDEPLSTGHVREVLVRACGIWSDELRLSYIGNEFAEGSLPKSALIGWLIEMYHYIRDFPDAIEHAAAHASGPLKEVLCRYAREERGHEGFVLQTLVNLGMSSAEVTTSIPLLSTRLVGFLMRELFELEPSSALMVAAVIEAQEFDEAQVSRFKARLHEHYGVDVRAFDPYFRHQEIDVSLGHAALLARHLNLIEIDDAALLDQVVNKIHDLKHAFDLQGIEIKAYFTALNGKYLPRQPVTFASI